MTLSSGTPLSKGMRMIAAYRAERLSQRPALRAGLQQPRAASRPATAGSQAQVDQESSEVVSQSAETATVVIDTGSPGSVFAHLVNSTAASTPGAAGGTPDGGVMTVPASAGRTNVAATPAANAAAPPQSEPVPTATCERPPVSDLPLAAIGFGPGMLIRLSQLGMHTIADLAGADAGTLRAELGEISRLVDVEAWILRARQASGTGVEVG